MVSMKLDKQAAESVVADAPEPPAYPYGLCLELDNETLEKLGLSDLPDVGDEFTIQARVKVTRASSSETEGGGAQRNASLQVTALGIGAATEDGVQDAGDAKKAATADKMYATSTTVGGTTKVAYKPAGYSAAR